MSDSRFQTIIIVGLAFMLGFAFSSPPAVGYPAAAISKGENPLWSVGGTLESSGTITVTAPSDQDAVITDIILSNNHGSIDIVTLTDHEGSVAAKFHLQTYNSLERHINHSYSSGIHVPAGHALSMTSTGSVYYSLSGYHAQP